MIFKDLTFMPHKFKPMHIEKAFKQKQLLVNWSKFARLKQQHIGGLISEDFSIWSYTK